MAIFGMHIPIHNTNICAKKIGPEQMFLFHKGDPFLTQKALTENKNVI